MPSPSAAPLVRPHQIWHRAFDDLCEFLSFATLCVGALALLVAALACAYMLKRAAGLDLVPGVDMLPDEEIESVIKFVLEALS